MGTKAGVVLYVLALVTVIVGVDVLFFRHLFWARLMANAGAVVHGVLPEVYEARMSWMARNAADPTAGAPAT
jgi:hypothetical protein